MKPKNLLLALALPVIVFFSACGDPAKPKPSISLAAGAQFVSSDISVMSDSLLKFSISATAGSDNLTKIVASSSTNGAAAKTFFDSSVAGKSVAFTIKNRLAASVDDKIVFTFTANDGNGETASKSITITVIPPTAPLLGFSGQMIWNSRNTGFENAYDLNKGVGLLLNSPATLKDLMDKTTPSMEQFSKIWGSDNNSKFVKVTANDFTNASTTVFIYNLWKANSAAAKVQTDVLAVGDTYLVKSGQNLPFTLYLVKVTKIQDLTVVGNHNDYIEFSYKMIDN